jgi:hypothetical protein
MKKSTEIGSELDKTASRITELEKQHDEQTTAFEATQKAFIAGNSGLDELHAEQGKMTLLAQGLESLKTIYQRLKANFLAQSEQESRADDLKRMTDAANSVPLLVDDYQAVRAEFGLIVEKYATILVAKKEKYCTQQRLYQSIFADLDPTPEEIADAGVPPITRMMAATGFINHPPIEYGEAVALAENLLLAKLHKEASQRRIASAKARQNAAVGVNLQS